MIIVLEIDNVLCHTPPWTDRELPGQLLELCKPRPAAIQKLRELHVLGHELVIVTNRGPQTATATRRQLDAWAPDLSPHIGVRTRPRLVFDAKEALADKQRAFNDLGAHVVISGDPEDHVAAARSHARFVSAGEFELHGIVSLRTVSHVA